MTWYIVGVSNVFFIAGGIVGLGAIVSFVGYRGRSPVPATAPRMASPAWPALRPPRFSRADNEARDPPFALVGQMHTRGSLADV